jgi:hypothetical protein
MIYYFIIEINKYRSFSRKIQYATNKKDFIKKFKENLAETSNEIDITIRCLSYSKEDVNFIAYTAEDKINFSKCRKDQGLTNKINNIWKQYKDLI